ncbi:MAG TPA: transcriptional regulator [Burkholderiaceae bacterium]|jgi:hypothetical protein|nr:transcriptional regulator [Burkholderiaceae bacterium]
MRYVLSSVPQFAELRLAKALFCRGPDRFNLNVQQPSIAKLERRTDMYVSTLRSHMEAMGGQLGIIARFPDGAVKIGNFADLAKDAA